MRQKLNIVLLLCCFIITIQDDQGNKESVTIFDLELLKNIFNNSLPTSDEDPAFACSLTSHDLNSLGLTVTYSVVILLSLMGNSMVVFVVWYMERGRTTTDVFLMHLALADLLFSLTLPFWVADEHTGWIFGNFLCKVLSGIQEASIYGSTFLLTCISIDRYFAIVKALQVVSSRRHLVTEVCAVVWLTALVLSLPVMIQRETMAPEELEGHVICYENITGESSDQWRISLRILRHILGFFLPLVVMVFCYGCTVVTLFPTRNQQKFKAMRVILVVVLAFILCWLPHNVAVLTDTLMRGGSLGLETCEMRSSVTLVLSVTKVMAFAHCAVNPVLYAFIGQKFRAQMVAALYKYGLISKSLANRRRSSSGSLRSRNTSVTL